MGIGSSTVFAMAKSQSSISMLILSNWGTFLFSRKIVIKSWHFLQTQ